MRYYVVVEAGETSGIVGEVLRESFDDGRYRDSSLAANVAGERGRIFTLAELSSTVGGVDMIARWESGDDSRSDRLGSEDERPHLSLVHSTISPKIATRLRLRHS